MERLIKFNNESTRNNVYLSIKRGNSEEYKKYLFENFVYYVYTRSVIREVICLSNIDFAIKTAMSINPSIMELQGSFNNNLLIKRVCKEVELFWLCKGDSNKHFDVAFKLAKNYINDVKQRKGE